MKSHFIQIVSWFLSTRLLSIVCCCRILIAVFMFPFHVIPVLYWSAPANHVSVSRQQPISIQKSSGAWPRGDEAPVRGGGGGGDAARRPRYMDRSRALPVPFSAIMRHSFPAESARLSGRGYRPHRRESFQSVRSGELSSGRSQSDVREC